MVARHDPKVRLYLNGDWRDVTEHVLSEAKVNMSRGRGDAATVTPPQRCGFGLLNTDLRYSQSNPLGPYFGYIGQNTPTEVAKRMVTDTYTRTVVDDWGTSDTGQVWTGGLFGAGGTVAFANWQVAAGVGTMSVPVANAYRGALLENEVYLDVDVQVDVSVPVTNITGAGIEPGNIYLRSDGGSTNYYLCRVLITTAEAVTVTFHHGSAGELATPITVAGLTHTAAQVLRVRVQAEGNTLRAKVWPASAGEPYAWNITIHDTRVTTPGFVGVRSGVALGNTNALPWVFSYDNFRVSSMRYAGELSSLITESDVSNRVRTAAAQADGILRRLGQGDAPLQSVMRRAILGLVPAPVAYWPCEDQDGATGGPSSGLPGGASMLGTPDYEADDIAFPCSAPLLKLTGVGGSLTAAVPPYVSSGSNQVRWLMQTPSSGITNGAILLRIFTIGGSTGYWAITYNTGGGISLTIFNAAGASVFSSGFGFDIDGLARRYSLELIQNGANIDWNISEVHPDGAGGTSGTLAGHTFGRITEVLFAPGENTVMGHITVENQVTDTFALRAQLGAHTNETAVARLIRLTAENELPFAYVGTAADSTPMGPQRVNTLIHLMRECANTDGGTLGESRGVVGLTYRTRASTYAQSPRLTLDVALKHLRHPFQPTPDDRDTVNDITVKRSSGGEFRRTLDAGRMSTLVPPTGIGRYDDTHDANSYTEADAGYLADWLLALGTIDEPRYPNLGIVLDAPAVSSLLLSALDVDTDDLVRVINAGTAVGIYDDIDQLARGYKEVLSNHTHTLKFNATPASVHNIAVLDSTARRLDSGSSTLTSNITNSATSFSVTTTAVGDLWITTAANAAEFPCPITIGGERMSLTAVTGATSPQTFTVTRSVNGVVKAHSAGAAVHPQYPTRTGM